MITDQIKAQLIASFCHYKGWTPTSWHDMPVHDRETFMGLVETMTSLGQNVKITFEQRSHDWMAFMNYDRARWGCGTTREAAVRDCLTAHAKDADMHGIDIESAIAAIEL